LAAEDRLFQIAANLDLPIIRKQSQTRDMPNRKGDVTDATKATDARHPLPPSHSSHGGFIPPHGGYEKLFSYPKTQIIYDATVRFCDRFIDRKSRTHDQMVQAARSGNKNIAEGSRISGTSKESELKLTNVARASLEELLGDYQDYLRQHKLKLWDKNSKEALYVRKLGKKDNLSYEDFREFIETRPAETVANILICMIHQANYLLDQQLRRLEKDFLEQGGLRERMTRARLAARARQLRETPYG
jgi:four helix bundle suffix protein